MSKAYDRVEWCFLESIMRQLGFAEVFIRRIMSCVTTVSYSFSLNGEDVCEVKPTRGLRQGDPISPYLFLLISEGLSMLFRNAQRSGTITGIRVCRNAPEVSHVLFADDAIFFCQATPSQASNMVEILRLYESWTGQQINFQKSNILFSGNVHEHQ